MRENLGDAVGRLAAPPSSAPFDAFRMELVDRLLTLAGKGPLTHAVWVETFQSVVQGVEKKVIADADAEVRGAARYSRYPERKLYALLPTPERAELFRNQLYAAGMPLERFEGAGLDALTQRARGVALETAWENVVEVARREVAAWHRVAATVLHWRRAAAPLWIGTGASLAIALICALWLGGFVDAPIWFDPIAERFWAAPFW